MAQITLVITLKSGVKLKKSAHVETLKDVGRFFGAGKQFVRMVSRLIPDFAGEPVEKLELSVE